MPSRSRLRSRVHDALEQRRHEQKLDRHCLAVLTLVRTPFFTSIPLLSEASPRLAARLPRIASGVSFAGFR